MILVRANPTPASKGLMSPSPSCSPSVCDPPAVCYSWTPSRRPRSPPVFFALHLIPIHKQPHRSDPPESAEKAGDKPATLVSLTTDRIQTKPDKSGEIPVQVARYGRDPPRPGVCPPPARPREHASFLSVCSIPVCLQFPTAVYRSGLRLWYTVFSIPGTDPTVLPATLYESLSPSGLPASTAYPRCPKPFSLLRLPAAGPSWP